MRPGCCPDPRGHTWLRSSMLSPPFTTAAPAGEVVTALTLRSRAHRHLGEFVTAGQLADRLSEWTPDVEVTAPLTAASALHESALSLLQLGRSREADRWLLAARRIAPGSRIAEEAGSMLALSAMLQGEVRRGRELRQSLGDVALPAPALRLAAALDALERDDMISATRELDLLDLAAPSGEHRVLALIVRAWVKLFSGEAHGALHLLRELEVADDVFPCLAVRA